MTRDRPHSLVANRLLWHLFVTAAEHNVQHIYTKVGFSTRAGVALYAMEHDLVRMQ